MLSNGTNFNGMVWYSRVYDLEQGHDNIQHPITRLIGGKSTLDLCYASSEEIPELQRPCRATGNRRNLQCEDDSILRANVTRDKVSPCLSAVS